jgi:Nitrate and nitrite sensing/ANTAR domain
MKSGLNFLVAAKRCEIAELQALALTSALVNLTGQLVHGLQRERGLSNLYLGSSGARFAPERETQISECKGMEAELRACFDSLDTDSATVVNGARLFSRIAYVLHGLDALPGLRAQVEKQAWTARKATDAYVRLIAGLLTVVFEAADSATNPTISRLLVARLNFMQGKEWAGQERAVGSALYASGRADASEQQRLLHLIDSQERCLQVFTEFSSAALGSLWSHNQHSATLAELERMRRVLCTAAHGAALDAGQSPAWFACCSQRMDSMKGVEDQLAQELLRVCEDHIAAAQHDLQTFTALGNAAPHPSDTLSFFQDAPAAGSAAALASNAGSASLAPPHGYGLQLERSILELVQEQARRLQTMGDELDTVRASLNERKLVERAKGLLMAHRRLSEEEAHKTMRQMAMNQNRRLVEVAEAVLAMADVLPERRP